MGDAAACAAFEKLLRCEESLVLRCKSSLNTVDMCPCHRARAVVGKKASINTSGGTPHLCKLGREVFALFGGIYSFFCQPV